MLVTHHSSRNPDITVVHRKVGLWEVAEPSGVRTSLKGLVFPKNRLDGLGTLLSARGRVLSKHV